jgi:Skp family chaperone for outer membrane proteins
MMKKITILFLSALVITGTLFTASVNAQAVGNAKIILVDFDRVTRESLVGKDVRAQIESARITMEARAGELEKSLLDERNALQAQRTIIAPDAFEAKAKEFTVKQTSAQAEMTGKNQSLQRAAQQANSEIQRTLKPIVLTMMKEKGASIVLDKGLTYHSEGGIDVTTTIIERLDLALSTFKLTLPK